MAGRITQFGTSRFLQGHADLFVHQAREAGQNIGPITVIKTTAGGSRDHRVAAFNDTRGFPIRLRGFDGGKLSDETITVKSVTAALDANSRWPQVIELFVKKTDIVFSNVGDSGYEISPEEQRQAPSAGNVPQSFLAKLLVLLHHRFERGGAPLLILPCELLSNNGAALRQALVGLAKAWLLPEDFLAWLSSSVTICNTLVDRIVSEPLEPIGAIAEPYGLWAIEYKDEMEFPFEHPNVVYTKDLEPFLRLKLHILNLGHTYLAEIWKTENRPAQETVKEILKDVGVKTRLLDLYQKEIIPGFAARRLGDQAISYVATTLQRFENPFLEHRVSDIYQNHAIKVERRALAFMDWAREAKRHMQFPVLEGLSLKYVT